MKFEFKYRDKPITLHFTSAEDHLAKYVMETGKFYEWELLEYLDKNAPKCGLYIDAGANIGNHSIYFHKFCTPYVISIEPNPKTFACMLMGYLDNRIAPSLTYIVGKAVSNQDGYCSLFMPSNGINNEGMMRVKETEAGRIPVATLDHIVQEYRLKHPVYTPISLIKLDIEFMELEALQGATQCLVDKPLLVVETLDKPKIDDFLTPLGYEAVECFYAHWSSPTYIYKYTH